MVKVTKFSAICFDYGGVLVPSKPIIPGIAKILGIPESDLRKVYYQNNHLAGVGDLSYEDLWLKLAKQLNQEQKAEAIWQHMSQQFSQTLDLKMVDLIKNLKDLGYKLGLLSNNTKENGQKIRTQGIEPLFDSFLISAEIGLQKPDPKAFTLMFEQLGVTPNQAIFTDDSEKSLSTADQIGYHPILFRGYQDFYEKLRKLSVL